MAEAQHPAEARPVGWHRRCFKRRVRQLLVDIRFSLAKRRFQLASTPGKDSGSSSGDLGPPVTAAALNHSPSHCPPIAFRGLPL
jgi:hypothetical protein